MGKNSRFVCVCNGMFMRALKSRNAYISLAVTLGGKRQLIILFEN